MELSGSEYDHDLARYIPSTIFAGLHTATSYTLSIGCVFKMKKGSVEEWP